MLSSKEMRNAIIQAISKRSQTKFAKLFSEFDAEPTQTKIVLLLAELVEQKDFYVDFNIHLRYFLDLYEELEKAASNKNFQFNEAGLLVHNATKIYERRVDCVLQRVEDQLASLAANVPESKQNSSTEESKELTKKNENAEKPTRKRKRLIESTQDPFEMQWTRRKFKKLADGKRFGLGTKIDRDKLIAQKLHVENYLHPALWKYSEIVDLENEEEIDSKRNYRLFTSYVEHRYNTLVPDINFRLYYKMKDYLDSDERDDEHLNNSWPPLSQAFVKQYLKMEDRALAYVQNKAKRRRTESPENAENCLNSEENAQSELLASDSGISLSCSLSQNDETIKEVTRDKEVTNSNAVETENINGSLKEVTVELTTPAIEGENVQAAIKNDVIVTNNVEDVNSVVDASNVMDDNVTIDKNNKDVSVDESNLATLTESGLGSSIADSFSLLSGTLNSTDAEIASSTALDSMQIDGAKVSSENATPIENIDNQAEKSDLNNEQISSNVTTDSTQITNADQPNLRVDSANKETIELIVHIETDVLNDNNDYVAQQSPQNDEGVCFSDIDDAPLTPIIMQIEKSVSDDFKNTKVDLNDLEKFHLPPHQMPVEFWPIKLNIFEFPTDILKKMRRPKLLTDLGEDMELYLKSRCYKRNRAANEMMSSRQRRLFDRSASSASFVYNTPPPSPCDSVLLGFGEEGKPFTRPYLSDERSNRLSRDSGVENDLLMATPEKNAMLFSPIFEHEELNNDNEMSTAGQPNEDNVGNNLSGVEILENIVLNAAGCETNISALENVSSEQPNQNDKAMEISVKNAENENLHETVAVQNESEEITATNKEQLVPKDAAITHLEHEIESGKANVEIESFMNVTNADFSEPFGVASSIANNDKNVELCDDTVAKIQTWHRKLQPILAQSRERHHFDVFQIGTNIINEFNANPDDKITFQHVMKHQDPSYVSRYFLSALLLVNQGNIALTVNNKSDNAPTDWSDVSLKLLSTTRHVVAVEDNIGMVPTKAIAKAPRSAKSPTHLTTPPKKAMSPKLLPPPAQALSKKRKLTNTAPVPDACVVNLCGINTIKPIGKTPRLSTSEDSGIASLESDSFDMAS